jgi:hypothetical protein
METKGNLIKRGREYISTTEWNIARTETQANLENGGSAFLQWNETLLELKRRVISKRGSTFLQWNEKLLLEL